MRQEMRPQQVLRNPTNLLRSKWMKAVWFHSPKPTPVTLCRQAVLTLVEPAGRVHWEPEVTRKWHPQGQPLTYDWQRCQYSCCQPRLGTALRHSLAYLHKSPTGLSQSYPLGTLLALTPVIAFSCPSSSFVYLRFLGPLPSNFQTNLCSGSVYGELPPWR